MRRHKFNNRYNSFLSSRLHGTYNNNNNVKYRETLFLYDNIANNETTRTSVIENKGFLNAFNGADSTARSSISDSAYKY